MRSNSQNDSNSSNIAVLEPRSNTMRMGIHEEKLVPSAREADQVIWAELGERSSLSWLLSHLPDDGSQIINQSVDELMENVEVVIFDNFQNLFCL